MAALADLWPAAASEERSGYAWTTYYLCMVPLRAPVWRPSLRPYNRLPKQVPLPPLSPLSSTSVTGTYLSSSPVC